MLGLLARAAETMVFITHFRSVVVCLTHSVLMRIIAYIILCVRLEYAFQNIFLPFLTLYIGYPTEISGRIDTILNLVAKGSRTNNI